MAFTVAVTIWIAPSQTQYCCSNNPIEVSIVEQLNEYGFDNAFRKPIKSVRTVVNGCTTERNTNECWPRSDISALWST